MHLNVALAAILDKINRKMRLTLLQKEGSNWEKKSDSQLVNQTVKLS